MAVLLWAGLQPGQTLQNKISRGIRTNVQKVRNDELWVAKGAMAAQPKRNTDNAGNHANSWTHPPGSTLGCSILDLLLVGCSGWGWGTTATGLCCSKALTGVGLCCMSACMGAGLCSGPGCAATAAAAAELLAGAGLLSRRDSWKSKPMRHVLFCCPPSPFVPPAPWAPCPPPAFWSSTDNGLGPGA